MENRQNKNPDTTGREQEHKREIDNKTGKRDEGTPIYLTTDSTLQTPAEHRHDQSVDPRQDKTREVSEDDLHDIKLGKLTGRDDTNSDEQ